MDIRNRRHKGLFGHNLLRFMILGCLMMLSAVGSPQLPPTITYTPEPTPTPDPTPDCNTEANQPCKSHRVTSAWANCVTQSWPSDASCYERFTGFEEKPVPHRVAIWLSYNFQIKECLDTIAPAPAVVVCPTPPPQTDNYCLCNDHYKICAKRVNRLFLFSHFDANCTPGAADCELSAGTNAWCYEGSSADDQITLIKARLQKRCVKCNPNE